MWWPLEKAIQEIDQPTSPAAEYRQSPADGLLRYVPVVVVAALCGIAIGSSAYWVMARASASARPVSQPGVTAPSSSAGIPVPVPAAAPSGVVVYHVQRGDTWWRLAASFTGRGTNWRALEAAARHLPLRSGAILRLDRATLGDSSTGLR
jgi:nucleoid-associated protein YgaU